MGDGEQYLADVLTLRCDHKCMINSFAIRLIRGSGEKNTISPNPAEKFAVH